MNTDRELLLRYLREELSSEEAQSLRARLDSNPDLRRQLERIDALQHTLQAAKPYSFAPYFSERVLRRLSPAEAATSLYESLRWAFARTAVAGLAIAGALGAYNLIVYQGLGFASSLVEAAFGLPSTSLADALATGSL